jgi:hypothetical protein
MKKYLIKAFLFVCILNIQFCHAQVLNKVPVSYSVYLLANKIGAENCTASDSGQSTIYNIDYTYNDRGAKRKLNSRIAINKNNTPGYLNMSGFTSRWSQVNINLQTPGSTNNNYFTIAASAPATLQQLLITFWKQHNQPQTITALPNHRSINIIDEGYDSISFNGTNLLLQRLMIKGLIWGNEFAWITNEGKLVFLSTNDTEGDKTEIINSGYGNLFGKLLLLSDKYAIDEVAKEFPAIKISTVIQR